MTWLSCKEVAELLSVTARDVQLSKNKYEYRYVNGKGRGGRPLQIALESLPQAAQDLYNHKQHEANDILHFTGKQREQADYRAQVVDMYQKSKLSPQDFVKTFNEENPEDPINKSKLFRWQHKYESKQVVNLIDNRGAYNKGMSSIPDEVWDFFYCAYMTQQKRSIKLCYDITVKHFGNDIPSVSTFERKVKTIPLYPLIEFREGENALKDMLPAMERCRDDILSNDMWCSDHHLIDIFVRSADGKKAVRLWLTVFHDMKSNKIVSYFIRNADPNATAVKQCFRLGVEEFGMPNEVYFDNGKDYRSKYFSRDYPMSLRNQLGFNIVYATPYHGQAKPTERFFGTFESRFSKLFPTYAGCNAKDRPECMMTTEVKIIKAAPELNEYIGYLADYIEEYNNTKSRGEGMNNQCPNKVYFDNLKIKRTVSDHDALRILCGTAHERVVQKNGITVDGRTYRSEYLIPYLKQKVTVIFDPDNMDKVSVFDMESKAICVATATVRPLFRHTTEEDYRQAGKEKKAVRAFNKKYKPARELSIQQLVAKQQFEELQYQQNLDTKVVEQINPMVATNSQKLKETEKPQRIPKEESIASILLKSYEAEKKAIGG